MLFAPSEVKVTYEYSSKEILRPSKRICRWDQEKTLTIATVFAVTKKCPRDNFSGYPKICAVFLADPSLLRYC